MLKGLDVSYVQGRISDWKALYALGHRFVFVKVGEGNKALPDPRAADDIKGARDAGLKVGGYFFAYPLPTLNASVNRDPDKQAELHYALGQGIGLGVGDLPPQLDLEWPEPQNWAHWGCSAAQIRDWGLAYLAKQESLWGVTPGLYTYRDFWRELGASSETRFARSKLWMASYIPGEWPAPGQTPFIPQPWTDWTFWQTTGGKYKLPSGVPVDLDVFNGDEAALEALCMKPDQVVETIDPAAGSGATSSNA